MLLLEDDPAFRAAIREFLTEAGYTVREARSGIEGIQEVLTGDFAVVICDMMMPGLPGDLFYRAVERARPPLCERFIFMTGHRGNTTANDFIRAVNGRVLLKPFRLDTILAAMREVEGSQPDARETSPARSGASMAEVVDRSSSSPVRVLPYPQPTARVVPVPLNQSLVERTWKILPPETISPDEQWRWRRVAAGVITLLVVMTLIVAWHGRVEERAAVAANELRALETRWAVVARELDDARKYAEKFEKFAGRAAEVTSESQRHRWSTALERIVANTTGDIQVRSIRIRREGLGGAWVLRLGAQCAGNRLVADAFRIQLQQNLAAVFPSTVTTQFEAMVDDPVGDAAPAGNAGVSFTIVAKIAAPAGTASPSLR